MVKSAKKIRKMKEFEIINCKMNISFYKGQIRKNKKNKNFYSKQIVFMQNKLDKLENSVDGHAGFEVLSGKLKDSL